MRIDISNLEFIDKKLRKMATDAEKCIGVEFIITSLYRINDTGVHGQLPLRGIDFRMKNEEIGKQIVDYINSKWKYDPARPDLKCAILHNVGQGLHIHLQVHTNTIEV